MLRHRHTKLAVLTATALAALGGGIAVAASTGTLPMAAGDHPNTSATSTSHAPTSTTAHAVEHTAPASPTHASGTPGPDVTGPAKFGLCTAWAAGQGTTDGKKADSTAFQALAEAAGGAANIPTFCDDATPGGGAPQSSAPSGGENGQGTAHSNPTSNGNETSSGPPASAPGNSETGRSHRP